MVKRSTSYSVAALARLLARNASLKPKSSSYVKRNTRSVMTRKLTKRRVPGTTVQTRRNQKETDTPSAEFTRQTVTVGKKVALSPYRIIKQNMQSTVYGFRAYSQFGGSNGSIQLLNTSTTATTGTFTTPLHMWELTSSVNVVNGSVVNPNICWIPIFSNPTNTGTLSWSNPHSLTVENSDSAATIVPQYPIGNDTLDWAQAKMIFYCPLTLPCRYQIDIVQLKDTRLVPDASTTNTFAAAFYQAMLKRFVYNPLETGDYKYNKYLKVLYTNSFILNPKESTEVVNTIFREVNIFLRLNRRATYDWQDQDTMDMLTANDGQVNKDAFISTQVHPRARIFMIIRAQARNGAAFSANNHPSYDMVLKLKHSNLSS